MPTCLNPTPVILEVNWWTWVKGRRSGTLKPGMNLAIRPILNCNVCRDIRLAQELGEYAGKAAIQACAADKTEAAVCTNMGGNTMTQAATQQTSRELVKTINPDDEGCVHPE